MTTHRRFCVGLPAVRGYVTSGAFRSAAYGRSGTLVSAEQLVMETLRLETLWRSMSPTPALQKKYDLYLRAVDTLVGLAPFERTTRDPTILGALATVQSFQRELQYTTGMQPRR